MAVGELFLSAFFQVLFDRLASAELLNFVTQEGVGSTLKKWEEKLKMIRAVLSNAEEKQLTEKAVKLWLDDLRDLAYDVEDILDEFATEASVQILIAEDQTSSTRKVRSLIPACFTGLTPGALKFDIKIGSKIKVISSRLEEIWENSSKLGLEKIAGGTSTPVWERPPSTCLPIEPAVYGRDEDKAKILGLVLDESRSDANFHVISVVGMGGVGKTTLARLVYNDKAVEDFDLRAWVCVSHDFDVLRISQAILKSITFAPCNLKELNQVQLSLKKEIVGRKFLIVLDDVWSKNSGLWKILRSPLMAGSPGSKVLVTTRSKDVVLTIGPIKYRHDLKLLSDDDCWSVFEKHAFESRAVHAHQNLELIRQKVVEKCRGLPLAAATLGGLLCCRQRDDEWEDVLNSKIWDLSEESDILPVLRLSYHHLPSHLKRCFAYCAIFPRNYKFEEKELVFLWMAEGLIQQSKHNKEMEHMGSEYFRELLSRSFFQPSNTEKHGKRSSKFVMHDLVTDLAQWAGGPTSLQLDDALRAKKQQKTIGKVRHFSYASGNYDGKNKFDFFHDAGCLRTFLPMFISSQSRYITNMVLSDLLPKLKKLKSTIIK